MATTVTTTYPGKGQVKAQWASLANGETGQSVSIAHWADKTVQAGGTFGAGGSVAIEGSQDGTTWGAVTDPTGTAIALTDGKPRAIVENPFFLRARVTAGDGTSAILVTIYGSRE